MHVHTTACEQLMGLKSNMARVVHGVCLAHDLSITNSLIWNDIWRIIIGLLVKICNSSFLKYKTVLMSVFLDELVVISDTNGTPWANISFFSYTIAVTYRCYINFELTIFCTQTTYMMHSTHPLYCIWIPNDSTCWTGLAYSFQIDVGPYTHVALQNDIIQWAHLGVSAILVNQL